MTSDKRQETITSAYTFIPLQVQVIILLLTGGVAAFPYMSSVARNVARKQVESVRSEKMVRRKPARPADMLA